jgi:hypothetical protein
MFNRTIVPTNEYEYLQEQNEKRGAIIHDLELRLAKRNNYVNSLISEKSKFINNRNDYLVNFNIRRAVVGKRGSGKTYFTENTLLKTLSNYFVVCPKGEYKKVAANLKYEIDNTISVLDNVEEILAIIKNCQTNNKTVVLDADYILGGYDYLTHLSMMSNINFILITQSIRKFSPQLFNYIDYFHTTSFENLVQDYNYSGLHIDSSKIHVISR